MKLFLSIVLSLSCALPASAAEKKLTFGRFGDVVLYQPEKIERAAVFVSGDGGWNLGVVDMARSLERLNTLVIGVNIAHYLKSLRASKDACYYPAADFEELSQFVQKDLALPVYIKPVLVGYSSGATLVYNILAQAPPGTFKGALSMGFCPDLPTAKPFCKGLGLEQRPLAKTTGYYSLPTGALENPWIAFQGTIDQVCSATDVENFVKNVKGGDIVLLPKVGHGFGVTKNWEPQFETAFKRISDEKEAAVIPAKVADLPLVELPVANTKENYLAVIISGDGGWAGIDREVASVLLKDDVPVVGLDSLKYFWKARDPGSAAKDVSRIMEHYLPAWGREKAVLIGYSRGADVLPFIVNRLPPETRAKVALVALLAPEEKAEFEFHLSDWIGNSSSGIPLKPEMDNWKGPKLICFYGKSDNGAFCKDLDPVRFTVVALGGGHHFGGAYAEIARRILDELH